MTHPSGFSDSKCTCGPMSPITSYPLTINNPDGTQSPAPQRYSLISLDGSLLVGPMHVRPMRKWQLPNRTLRSVSER